MTSHASAAGGEPGSVPGDAARSDMLAGLSPEMRGVAEMDMLSMLHRVGPMPPPLFDKINEGHIDRIIKITEKSNDLVRKDRSESRKYTLAYVTIGAILFASLTAFLVVFNAEIYLELLKIIGAFVGGVGSGIWIKNYWDRKSR